MTEIDNNKDTQNDTTELLEKARGGDSEALEALLRAVQPQLYRFSLKMCRHEEDAEDVLQDSMLSLARSFRDFRGASSLSTWLYSITRSFCIKKRRKSKFAPKHEESLDSLASKDQENIQSQLHGPDKQAESAELWRQIRNGIGKIEPAYREILVLRDIEGLSAKEVAEIVGLTVPAVKSRLHRARSQLREQLTMAAYEPGPGCPNIRQVFSEHLEGDLSPDICSSMEAHVASCPTCATECIGLKQALNACSTATFEVPEEVRVRIQIALRQIIQKKPSSANIS
ncbi:MAG: sigma-70 family RNA polymerase sigma factor [Deltaproteobacteria bacterium]|nr:sigma-70 family RNA polymerase sigma factor [Deltaproteobacteria bacterium]